jgi:hypothetical protein
MSRTGTRGFAAAAQPFDRVELAKGLVLLRDVALPTLSWPFCGRSRRFHPKKELADTPASLQNRVMLSPLAGCRPIRSRQNCSRSPLVFFFAIAEPLQDRDRSSKGSSVPGAPRMAIYSRLHTTRTRILALHESGHSYRDICRTVKREGHTELKRGRAVKEHNIRSLLLAYMKDKRKQSGSDTKPKPQSVERFVETLCERGDATDATCRVFARPLYLAYVQHCHTANDAALSRVEFSKAFQTVTGCERQRHTTKRDFYAGIRLPACPRSAITHKATP